MGRAGLSGEATAIAVASCDRVNLISLNINMHHLLQIVDMPPGTGDIQITLSQTLALSGAVIVTTPHSLSVVDAVKGVSMFDSMNIPTLALVENMSYFECRHGERYYPFGKGGRERLLQSLLKVSGSSRGKTKVGSGLDRLRVCPMHSLPLTEEVSHEANVENEDISAPVVIRLPQSSAATTFARLADDVIVEVMRLVLSAQMVG